MKISKNRYLQGFVVVVLFLALVRLVFPSVAEPRLAEKEKGQDSKEVDSLKGISAASSEESSTADDASSASGEASSSLVADDLKKDELSAAPDTAMAGMASIFFDKDGKEVKHRIFSGLISAILSLTSRIFRFWLPTSMAWLRFRIVRRRSIARANWCMWAAILSFMSTS